MAVKPAKITYKGEVIEVPSAEIEGRTVVVSAGKWIRMAALQDQESVPGELVKNPEAFVAALKREGLPADVFTFFQRPPDVKPRFDIHHDWKNYAAIELTTFNNWWESLPQEARKNTRRAAKRGVVTKVVPFDDELARGIHKLCNEMPIRQGRPFWHYGKDFETIKTVHATYLERCDFIGAYFENELIGFIKMIYVDRLALMFHILAMNRHNDKRPMNALVAKAVEVAAEKGAGYLVYGEYVYGNKSQSSLVEFKRRNCFKQIDFPVYYIPLTWQGRIYVWLRLYRGLVGLLPEPVLRRALALRDWLYEKRAGKTPVKTEETA